MDIQKILDELRNTSLIHKASEHKINCTIANKAKPNDPAWLNAVREHHSKPRSEEWYKNHKKGIQERSNSSDWLEKVTAGNSNPEKRQRFSENYSGKDSFNCYHVIVGTNVKTGEKIYCYGEKQLKELGFTPSNLYRAISSGRKHKGYTWTKEVVDK